MAFAPAAFAALPTILGVVSTGLAFAGVVASTSAATQQANFQAQVAERNAKVQEDNAVRAQYNAQVQQQESDRVARGLIGEQIAAQSASGLKIGGRSQMLTRKSAKQLARLDSLNIRQAGDVEAYNYRVGAEDAAMAAGFARQSASNALTEGFLTGVGTLVGGASNFLKTSSFNKSTSLLGGAKAVGPTRLRFA